ncbi:hypothetical protein GLOTRDRAFT_131813 [Gloeophyllum trabeum ATCC 11539]|uniref:Pali-domain-containing protein n=1 Tax=Gloeophyllum trabeum (strain ATCC 11539 / FP-39264 / Madison 617) TaxID=670483 RepID=S7PY68_GLOTA|nr:uncharacterized protein GLOTRDRAFT_131813 [Gloeophyllum trabeum ATCC 11539]EPQ52581.1 hypothetical protein GLOTRDRAFT_131813 [Gloeophyllum trabeum ATCC 11539]
MTYNNPAFPVFVLTFGSFVLLILITFSVPFVSSFYFLHSSIAGGVRFGLWGWCLDDDTLCISPVKLGFDWNPQIVHGLTYLLVFYPISAIFAFFATLALIPLLCTRAIRLHSFPIYSLLMVAAAFTAFLAFICMIALFVIAMNRFHAAGYAARLGPAVWMSLVATIILIVMSFNSGCGTLLGESFAARPSRYPYAESVA